MKTPFRTLLNSRAAARGYVWLLGLIALMCTSNASFGQVLNRAADRGLVEVADSISQSNTALATITSLNPLCNCEVRLSVKPNPVQDIMHLTHGIKGGAEITVTDLIGRSYTLSKVPMEAEISVMGWPKGIYMVSLRLGQDRRVQTILVQ